LECRAGVIVLGPEHPHDDLADKLVLAASFAHAETEAPVIALGGGEFGCWQARRLLARGADPERVVVAGLGGAEISFAELDEVAATGVHLGFTNIGQGSILDREPRAALLAYAIRRYGVRRICLGTGSCSSWYGGPQAPPKTWGADALLDIRRRLLSYGIDASEVAEILKVDEWLFQGDESERS
jgi:predicted metal-dependent phosphotriesterase family hydrolase